MNPNVLPAVAALAGSAVGGLTSFLSTWLGQSSQIRAQLLLNDKARRAELYRDFVDSASTLYINALTSNTPDLEKMVSLYALVSRMRVVSSREVSDEAKKIARMILESYIQPNKDLVAIVAMVKHDTFDPMGHFAELCRAELEQLIH